MTHRTTMIATARSLALLGAAWPMVLMAAEPVKLPADPKAQEAILEQLQLDPRQAVARLPELLALANSSDLSTQVEALSLLEDLGASATSAVPALLPLLANSEPILRDQALSTLRAITTDKAALESVIPQLLKDKEPRVRVQAASIALQWQIGQPDDAIAILVSALENQPAGVRAAAIPGLVAAHEAAIPHLLTFLKTGNDASALSALETLAQIGPSAVSALPAILSRADSTAPAIQAAVVRAISQIGAPPQSALPLLVKFAQSPDVGVRVATIVAVGRYPTTAEQTLPLLRSALSDSHAAVRLAACDSLAQFGPAAAPAIPELSKALRDERGSITLHAMEALGLIGPEAVPELSRLLSVPEYAFLSLRTLDTMGPAARGGSGTILKLLAEKVDYLPQRDLCLAVAATGGDVKTASPILKAVLNDPTSPGRAAAAYALGRLGDRSAIKDLTNLAEDADILVRLGAAWSLLQMEPKNEEYIKLALPRLIQALALPDMAIRAEALRTLATLGERAGPAVGAIVGTLTSDDRGIRLLAANTLGDLGSAADPAVPALIQLAQDPQFEGRGAIVYALGRIGEKGTAAKAVLKDLVENGTPELRPIAAWSLLQIDPSAAHVQLATPVLLAAGQEGSSPAITVAVIRSLKRCNPENAEFLNWLKQLSTAEDPALRAAAASSSTQSH